MMWKSVVLLLIAVYSPLNCAVNKSNNPAVTLLAEITAKGQKVNAVAIEYEDNLLLGEDFNRLYRVSTQLDQGEKKERTIVRTYIHDKAEINRSGRLKSGRFVIIELNPADDNADLYALKAENTLPIKVRELQENGDIMLVEKRQISRVPHYYDQRLRYQIEQRGLVTLANGKVVDNITLHQLATKDNVKTKYLDQFTSGRIFLDNPTNYLNYRLYQPKTVLNKKYPLTIFLHGSGQVGSDNLAHLLSSKGAIATLQYEEGFILAPQYQTIFDPFDDVKNGQTGGIHWQTANRRKLLLAMLDQFLAENPQIDRNRIYLIGLSRGAEGALYLLLDRPDFFAAALLMSGREAYTIDWIDGKANKENLAGLKNTHIWFFHTLQDKIAPVKGTQINYHILANELANSQVKYTELSFRQVGDNGIVNNNAHNTWDLVFNSPEIIMWLLSQHK